ncbi:MAG: hypothetical protein Q9168_008339, partial [Polycauliona sp. 1 TL-2023]
MSSPLDYLKPPADGDNNTGRSILIITWLFTGISTVVVGLKVWTRLKIIRNFGADDYLTILALLLLLAFAPLITVSVHRGLGRYVYYLDAESGIQASKLAVLSNPLIFLASAWPNISVAISIDRILVPTRGQQGVLYGIPILQCIFALICSIITYTSSAPLEGLWNPFIQAKRVPPSIVQGILYCNGALSAFTHIFLAVVPIFGLWRIRIKTKTKVGVCLLMDEVHSILNWAIIEAAFIIIAACIPSLRPFVRALGKSMHIDSAKCLFTVPKGYYHSHSRRHRPQNLVPRDSGNGSVALGSGTTATARSSPRDKYGSCNDDMEKGEGETTTGVMPSILPVAGGGNEGGEEEEKGDDTENGGADAAESSAPSTAVAREEMGEVDEGGRTRESWR